MLHSGRECYLQTWIWNCCTKSRLDLTINFGFLFRELKVKNHFRFAKVAKVDIPDRETGGGEGLFSVATRRIVGKCARVDGGRG